MNNKILVVYIATGDYINMFPGFIKSLHNFCPETEKTVIPVTDKDTGYLFNMLSECMSAFEIGDNVMIAESITIQHLPWPIVALMKFKYILDSINEVYGKAKFTHVFYFNSNIEFIKEVPEEVFLHDKLIAVHNCGWDHLGHDPLKFTYGKPVDERSLAHIPTNDYEYVQSSVFGGPIDHMIDVCITCHNWTERDLAHNLIPCFHDESYWNKYVVQNPDLVKILTADYNSDKEHMVEWGHPNASIVMRDSSKTQYEYKDRFHE